MYTTTSEGTVKGSRPSQLSSTDGLVSTRPDSCLRGPIFPHPGRDTESRTTPATLVDVSHEGSSNTNLRSLRRCTGCYVPCRGTVSLDRGLRLTVSSLRNGIRLPVLLPS